ncbi:MAG TPA: prepilin-type N-terminal cleavage/methylation domain-containing protein [Longimicrobiales bacterium]
MRGFSLLELLLAVALGGLVAGALFGLLHGQERLARAQVDSVTAAEALRIAATTLGSEVRLLAPAEDLALATPESVAVRAFRALGVVCGRSGGETLVRRRGLRAADPAKDSVLLVRPDSPALAVPLLGAGPAPAACAAAAGEEVERWALGADALPPVGSLLLLYETGTYGLTGAALRYRRGEGGRQPLTVAWLDDTASGFELRDAAGGRAANPAEAAAIIARVTTAAPTDRRPGRRHVLRMFLALPNGAVRGDAP